MEARNPALSSRSAPVALALVVAVALAPGFARAQVAPAPAPPPARPPAPTAPPAGEEPSTAPLPPPRWDEAQARPPPPAAPAPDKRRARRDCDTHELPCDWLALLGSLERQAVLRALASEKLELEPSPWGKSLGRIVAVNHQVFGPSDGFLRIFNVLHATTRPFATEREVLLRPGHPWDQDLVDETTRKLRDPLFSSVAVVVPVRSPISGKVDLLVVTRDIWSLRFNSNYELQDGKLTFLTLSLSENNLLGRRKLAALVFEMDQGAYSLGPLYIDKNVLGKRLDLRVRGGPLFNRRSMEYEGSASTITFARPLWSLDSEWGAGVSWSHRYAINRAFRGTGLRTYNAPDTPEDDMVPWQYRQRRWSIDTHVVRGFGERVEQRVRFGHDLDSQHPTVIDGGGLAPEVRAAFIEDVLPRSERTSVMYTGYQLFTPRYRAVRNIETFDLAEDLRVGPDLDLEAGVGLRAIGSDTNFVRASATAGWSLALGDDGAVRVAAEISTRYENDDLIDNRASGILRVISPTFAIGRVLAEARTTSLWKDTQNRFVTVGGDSGLRGFAINEFEGSRKLGGQVELRTFPVRILLARIGLVAFYDVGDAADRYRDMGFHHDVGLGLRSLIPQFSPELFRFDFAVALNGPGAGFPGRFIAGYRQNF